MRQRVSQLLVSAAFVVFAVGFLNFLNIAQLPSSHKVGYRRGTHLQHQPPQESDSVPNGKLEGWLEPRELNASHIPQVVVDSASQQSKPVDAHRDLYPCGSLKHSNPDLFVDSQANASNSKLGLLGAAASGHSLATAAAITVLEAGGNAAEGAIAGVAVLAVVEPYRASLGGHLSGIVVAPYRQTEWVDKLPLRQKITETVSSQCTAPMHVSVMISAAEAQKLDKRENQDERKTKSSKSKPSKKLKREMRNTPIPGFAAGLCSLYVRHGGALPWDAILRPAIDLAEAGFELSTRASAEWARASGEAAGEGGWRGLFAAAPQAGQRVANARLGAVLKRLAAEGCGGFYGPGGALSEA
eukprot:1780726-Rhodomonas_salina.1